MTSFLFENILIGEPLDTPTNGHSLGNGTQLRWNLLTETPYFSKVNIGEKYQLQNLKVHHQFNLKEITYVFGILLT